jgi:hypothetical protein
MRQERDPLHRLVLDPARETVGPQIGLSTCVLHHPFRSNDSFLASTMDSGRKAVHRSSRRARRARPQHGPPAFWQVHAGCRMRHHPCSRATIACQVARISSIRSGAPRGY